MVYFKDTTRAQRVFIPRQTAGAAPALSVELTNTTSKDVTVMKAADLAISALFYCVEVSLPEGMRAGEYEYRVIIGGETMTTGLATVGKYRAGFTQFVKPIVYEQF